MKNVFNREEEPWIRPWNQEKFDDLYNRDERFFALVVKGLISWLNRNIVLYNKSINHFIFNTGSSYLYMESNGYEYNLSETTGEDAMYMQLPRCILEISGIDFPMEELSAPFSRGNYERRSGNQLQGFNAEIRRLPIELSINMKYYLSNFNETIILLQELIDKIIFQQYFNIIYLGQTIQCSVEFPGNVNPEINKIDMTSPDPNQRNITFDVKICTNYPLINTRTEIPTDKVICTFGHEVDLYNKDYESDRINQGEIINNDDDGYNEFINNLNDEEIKDKEIIDNINNIINNYDNDNDNTLDENEIDNALSNFDLNNDGDVDAEDLENILEKIKYENTDNMDIDAADTCHYKIDYKDLYVIIKLMNYQNRFYTEYDKLTNKLYVTNNDTGEVKEIDMIKYKINK